MSAGGGGFGSSGNPLGSLGNTNVTSTLSSGMGNFIGDLTGSNRESDALGNAANAQLEQQRGDRTLAMSFAAPSDMEMQQLQQAITMNNQDAARKQKLLDSADPALIEAGHQALDLMNGKASAALAPVQNQRAQDRKSLESTLQQRLGSDYATSTAGAQALNEFDRQTSNLMATTQQQTLAQFMGYAGAAEQFGNQQQNIANSASLANQRGAIGMRQVAALDGNPVNPGMQFSGDIARLGSQATYLNQMYQDGRQVGKTMLGQMGPNSGGADSSNGLSTSEQTMSGAGNRGMGSQMLP